MSEQEQRLAIAEACGWEPYMDSWECLVRQPLPDGGLVSPDLIPDYPHDLNAMYEAEKTIRNDFGIWARYKCNLTENVHATAYQRAEAFLRTLGKWKSS